MNKFYACLVVLFLSGPELARTAGDTGLAGDRRDASPHYSVLTSDRPFMKNSTTAAFDANETSSDIIANARPAKPTLGILGAIS